MSFWNFVYQDLGVLFDDLTSTHYTQLCHKKAVDQKNEQQYPWLRHEKDLVEVEDGSWEKDTNEGENQRNSKSQYVEKRRPYAELGLAWRSLAS